MIVLPEYSAIELSELRKRLASTPESAPMVRKLLQLKIQKLENDVRASHEAEKVLNEPAPAKASIKSVIERQPTAYEKRLMESLGIQQLHELIHLLNQPTHPSLNLRMRPPEEVENTLLHHGDPIELEMDLNQASAISATVELPVEPNKQLVGSATTHNVAKANNGLGRWELVFPKRTLVDRLLGRGKRGVYIYTGNVDGLVDVPEGEKRTRLDIDTSAVPSEQRQTIAIEVLVSTLVAILLIDAAEGKHKYGFYMLLRLIGTVGSGYWVMRLLQTRLKGWTWLFATVGLLLNPFVSIRLERQDWQVIDLWLGVLLVIWSAYWLFCGGRISGR